MRKFEKLRVSPKAETNMQAASISTDLFVGDIIKPSQGDLHDKIFLKEPQDHGSKIHTFEAGK